MKHKKTMSRKDPIIKSIKPSVKDMWHRQDLAVNDYFASVYADNFIIDEKNIPHKLRDMTNPIEGRHLYNLVRENKYTHTLEVGLAMGASAAWICQAHADNGGGSHIAIDPNQSTQYENLGRLLVDRCGLSKYLTVVELPSYRALPIILEQILAGSRPKLQLIYIDGLHLFSSTLLDFFYSDLILEIGGVIVVDDIRHKGVGKFLKYAITNLKNYKILETPCYKKGSWEKSTQATFIKLKEDDRMWNFHVDF
jgi:predicted O-methyltransferase YrrM